jgi:hypothetical protein
MGGYDVKHASGFIGMLSAHPWASSLAESCPELVEGGVTKHIYNRNDLIRSRFASAAGGRQWKFLSRPNFLKSDVGNGYPDLTINRNLIP